MRAKGISVSNIKEEPFIKAPLFDERKIYEKRVVSLTIFK